MLRRRRRPTLRSTARKKPAPPDADWKGPGPADGKLAGPPGAFVASINYYRTSSNPVSAFDAETKPPHDERLAVPTTVLWEDQDPIFPCEWSNRLDDFFCRLHAGEIKRSWPSYTT